ncbi:IclR family transcriptional regulator [Pseudalkalibacillus sp. A8]|uniref:IclR family transcriptional regulator n=1 Tax=Pseudalkalibacillus sp. A8 TaxID=3382641 RepID=UPI0038B63924
MSLKTLEKSLEVLKCFTEEKSSWGVRELANEINMNHSVVFRILKTFEEYGFLVQNTRTNKYELGLKFFEYSLIVSNKFKISDVFYPYMKELAESTGESVFLTWLDGNEGVCLLIAESDQTVKYTVSVGSRNPLYAGASHKVILAYLPREKQEQIIDKGIIKFTDNTITNSELIFEDLKKIKQQGWSYSIGEYTKDVAGIAVPIFNRHNTIVGSLTVATPSYRINDDKANEIIEKLNNTQKQLQHEILKHQITF